jgi:hypothetical protein
MGEKIECEKGVVNAPYGVRNGPYVISVDLMPAISPFTAFQKFVTF